MLGVLSFLIFKAYIIAPAAIVDENNIPDRRINANNPPIKPPLSLKRLDLRRRTNKIKIVDLREEIFKKVKGDRGFSNIKHIKSTPTIKIILRKCKKTQKKGPNWAFIKLIVRNTNLCWPQDQI